LCYDTAHVPLFSTNYLTVVNKNAPRLPAMFFFFVPVITRISITSINTKLCRP